MHAMTHREAARQLGDFVQIGDAYRGGKRTGGMAGRGSENKHSFVVAVSGNDHGHPRCIAAEPVAGLTNTALTGWMGRRPDADVKVVCDRLGAFRAASEGDHADTTIEASG